ncbi:hypothetical protein INT45_000220 [Circinella minor]|uniref:Uncharacterized protein n=1 Tax=Circinella minor TaxID=1195481 RepID=A0A8H7S3Y0_9FUNG|nr:hypothetical protein INT45_000220 [Circinella minor]
MPSITISLNKDDKSFDHLSTTNITCPDNDNNTNTTNHNSKMKRSRFTFQDIAEEVVAKEKLKTWKRKKQTSTINEKRSKSVALVGAIMEYLARRRQRKQHQPLINHDQDSIHAAESTYLL